MILILNLSKNIDFILNIFTTTSSCFTIIASIGASLPKNEDTDQIKGLINSIFLQKEYKTIYSDCEELIKLLVSIVKTQKK